MTLTVSQTFTTFAVTWHISEPDLEGGLPGSGLAAYTVQVCTDSPTNCQNLVANPAPSGTHTYTFRVWAKDRVDNETTQEQAFSTASVTKYYLFGGQRVAMRQGGIVTYLHGDHLGSVSLTTGPGGELVSQARYTPFGGLHWESGEARTDFGFTGQRAERGFGLMDYNARFYSSALGRFVSADSIIPGVFNPMAFDRYSYVMGNPLRYMDPSGHHYCDSENADPEECKNIDTTPFTHTGDPLPDDKHRKFGGAEAYAIFLEYQEICGWWNANCTVEFGLAEFLGMWILFESGANAEKADLIATIVAQNLYAGGWNPATCKTHLCYNGAFNFMAAYSSGSGPLFDGPESSAVKNYVLNRDKNIDPINGTLDGEAGARAMISQLGHKALNPTSVITWDQNNGPSNWGNINGTGSFRHEYKIPEFQVNGTARDTVYYYHDNFVVLTVNQALHWGEKGVDLSLYVP